MTQTTGREIQQVVASLAAELATYVGGKLDVPVEMAEATEAPDVRWVVLLDVDGSLTGDLIVTLGADGATRLAGLATDADSSDESTSDESSSEEGPSEERLAEPLAALWRGVLAELAGRPGLEGLFVTIEACEAADATAAGEPVSWYTMTMGQETMAVGFRTNLHADHHAGEDDHREAVAGPTPELPSNLDVVLDIDLPLSVRFGHTEMTLASLSRIGPGSVIALDRAPEDSVDVLVNGRLVARGEVVVVTGNYGVRVTEVVSAADRIRSLGA